MPDWSDKWFFVLVLAFLIFTAAGGYAPKWKAVFTKQANNSTGSGINLLTQAMQAMQGTGGIVNNAPAGTNAAPGLTF